MSRQTPQQIVDQLAAVPEGTRFQVLAPVVRGRKGEHVELFSELQTSGFARARVDGETVQLSDPPKLAKTYKHTIEVVVDRLKAKQVDGEPDRRFITRLTDSVETALRLAEGRLVVDYVDVDAEGDESGLPPERVLSEHLACPNEHPIGIEEIEPRTFSFNAPLSLIHI